MSFCDYSTPDESWQDHATARFLSAHTEVQELISDLNSAVDELHEAAQENDPHSLYGFDAACQVLGLDLLTLVVEDMVPLRKLKQAIDPQVPIGQPASTYRLPLDQVRRLAQQ